MTATSSAAAPDAKDRVLAAYPDYPRRRALVAIGSDAMFGAPAWAFADAYSAHAPTHVYRFDHTTWTLRALGLGATHGSEIVHIQHSYASYPGPQAAPARAAGAAGGGPAHAADLAGLRDQGLGQGRVRGRMTGRSMTPNGDGPASSGRPAT